MKRNRPFAAQSLLTRLGAFALAILVVSGAPPLVSTALGDGCFVFKWDKAIDNTEPSQKAIIVYDSGREDLLLQVKYEGPLKEFGWLIPVPSVPEVSKGSMDAFYELSQLTQEQAVYLTAGIEGKGGEHDEPAVKVIKTKTVGAYEVAVLSARNANSLETWLKANGYSIPSGKEGVVNDYIQQGWFFVAAKIHLDQSPGLKMAAAAPKFAPDPARAQQIIQKKLAIGELHPILISFDSPRCVFPLKISSILDKTSEVSLYVLSQQPLVNRFLYDEIWTGIENHATSMIKDRWIEKQDNPQAAALKIALNSAWEHGLFLARLRDGTNSLRKSAKSLPRLRGKKWYVAKWVQTFSPAQMRDLEFEPAPPVLSEALTGKSGRLAALMLTRMDEAGSASLAAALQGSDATARRNAASVIYFFDGPAVTAALPGLLKDDDSATRMNALRKTTKQWDKQFVEPVLDLFSDPDSAIRNEAVNCLTREGRNIEPQCLALATNANPLVRMSAIRFLLKVDSAAAPFSSAGAMLKDTNSEMRILALQMLALAPSNTVSRADLLQCINGPILEVSTRAMRLLQEERKRNGDTSPLFTTDEALSMATSSNIFPRNWGVSSLAVNADAKYRAKAVELMLPLLRDTNYMVSQSAFRRIQQVTGQTISNDDPAKWEAWWAANKNTFVVPAPATNRNPVVNQPASAPPNRPK